MNEQLVQEIINIIENAKLISELSERTIISDDNSFLAINLGTEDAKKVKVSLIRGSLGNYNASTNTPVLSDGTGLAGDSYEVSVSGVRDFGSGSVSLIEKDVLLHTGTRWVKITKTQISDIQGLQSALADKASVANGDEFYIDENGLLRLNVSTYRQSELFTTGDSQTFNLNFEPTFILGIYVNGVYLDDDDYTYKTPNEIEILGTMEDGDKVRFIYEHFNQTPTVLQ